MDDIFDKVKEGFEQVKKKEVEVARQEEALQAKTNAVRQRETEVDADRRDLEKKLAALEKEKATMARVPVANTDLVQLNVQGEIFCTLRETLLQFPETRLAYMFNGRWKDKLHRDGAGNIFLDVSPGLFRKLLEYLTAKRLAGGEPVPSPEVSPDQISNFRLMLRYFEIESSVYSRVSCFSSRFKSPFIALSPDCTAATNTSSGMGYVLGEDVYHNEIVRFELEIEKLENPWMFFGIMSTAATSSTIHACSFNNNPYSYGWADKGGYWEAGVRMEPTECTIPVDVLREGHRVEMILDCSQPTATTLSIKVLPPGHSQEITDLPSGHSWHLHLNLVDCHDSVRLLKAERSSVENGN